MSRNDTAFTLGEVFLFSLLALIIANFFIRGISGISWVLASLQILAAGVSMSVDAARNWNGAKTGLAVFALVCFNIAAVPIYAAVRHGQTDGPVGLTGRTIVFAGGVANLIGATRAQVGSDDIKAPEPIPSQDDGAGPLDSGIDHDDSGASGQTDEESADDGSTDRDTHIYTGEGPNQEVINQPTKVYHEKPDTDDDRA